MSTIINARSPYYLRFVSNDASKPQIVIASMELYIWSGDKSSPPASATYTIEKVPLVAGSNYVVYEVSELIRDYLETEYYNNAVDAVWVKADTTLFVTDGNVLPVSTSLPSQEYLAIDGFGYFEEGANPRTSTDPTQSSYTPMVLQSNACINVVNGRDIRIPVFSEAEPTITTDIPLGVWSLEEDFWEASEPTWDNVGTAQNIVDSDDSADKIQYLIIDTENAMTGDTITFTSTTGMPNFHDHNKRNMRT